MYAPEHPGTSPDAHDDIYHLDNLWDLVLCYDELLTALKLDEVAHGGPLLRRHGGLRDGGGRSRGA